MRQIRGGWSRRSQAWRSDSPGAAAASRLLETLLFGVTPADPLTFALVTPALSIVATVACWLPGARAARLDPTAALRAD